MSERFVRCRSIANPRPFYGRLNGDRVVVLNGPPWLEGRATGDSYDLADVSLLAPVEPSKIVCIGLNYHAHVAASQSADAAPEYPLIFLKPPSAVIGPEATIAYPPQSERVDYEAELGIVIGRTAVRIEESAAAGYIFGLTCVNDVTARDLQKKDGQWSRAKGFDTFCPVGPDVVTGVDGSDLLVEGVLNGKVMQSGRTSQMIFKVPYLVSYISHVMTLNPGDLISTGTPSGIAPMKTGDVIEVRVEAVGCLRNVMG